MGTAQPYGSCVGCSWSSLPPRIGAETTPLIAHVSLQHPQAEGSVVQEQPPVAFQVCPFFCLSPWQELLTALRSTRAQPQQHSGSTHSPWPTLNNLAQGCGGPQVRLLRMIMGWQHPPEDGNVALGLQLPRFSVSGGWLSLAGGAGAPVATCSASRSSGVCFSAHTGHVEEITS